MKILIRFSILFSIAFILNYFAFIQDKKAISDMCAWELLFDMAVITASLIMNVGLIAAVAWFILCCYEKNGRLYNFR